MNRGIVIGVVALCMSLSCSVFAQGVKPYLADRTLARTLIEVEVPHTSFWSYLGIRITGPIRPKEGTVLKVTSSAYAPSPYQTDATPCVTASGTTVRPGVVATNFLPLGTVVSIDGKEYIVEDRMNRRYDGYYLDVWFPSTSEALDFGRKKLEITIVAYKEPGAEIGVTPSPSPEVDQSQGILEALSSPFSYVGKFIFTKTFNPNAYDVDCS